MGLRGSKMGLGSKILKKGLSLVRVEFEMKNQDRTEIKRNKDTENAEIEERR